MHLGFGSSGHEDSGIWPQAGGVHVLDGEGVLGGGSSVARSRGQLSAGRQARTKVAGTLYQGE